MKKVSFFLLLFLSALVSSRAQKVSGEWYGVGEVKKPGNHNSYLSELVLKQKGKTVTGEINYFYRSESMKRKISGVYDERTRTLELKATPLLNYQALDANGADCPMEGSFTLKVSRVETTLTGQFNPIYDYRLTCPAINIKFVKSIAAPAIPTPSIDEEEDMGPPAEIKQPAADKDVDALNQRAFELSPVIDVDSDSLKVTLYDNGDIDNDTISVFYNRKVLSTRQMLTAQGITFNLPLDTSINEIAMFAENLGRIPPNTALAVIYAGQKRFELPLSSSFIKNATLRFRRRVPVKDPKNIN